MRTEHDRCCDDIAVHNHGDQTFRDGKPYHYRHTFEWRPPKAIVYRAANRRFAVTWNRYPGAVIGVALQAGTRVLSIVWGRPGRVIDDTKINRA